jgi:hypothetical protein
MDMFDAIALAIARAGSISGGEMCKSQHIQEMLGFSVFGLQTSPCYQANRFEIVRRRQESIVFPADDGVDVDMQLFGQISLGNAAFTPRQANPVA